MSDMRELIDRLTAISEDRPVKGDGFLVYYSDKICVESEIVDITESGDIVLNGDAKFLQMLESLHSLNEGEVIPVNFNKKSSAASPAQATTEPASSNLIPINQVTKKPPNFDYAVKLACGLYWTEDDPYYFKDPDHQATLQKYNMALREIGYHAETDLDDTYTKEYPNMILTYKATGQHYLIGEDDLISDEHSIYGTDESISEAEYHGRKVPLGKPMKGDVKKSKVYVRDPKTGNVKKVNFGDKNMRIKKSIPGRRKSFRARHHCENPGPRTKARYWSCRAW